MAYSVFGMRLLTTPKVEVTSLFSNSPRATSTVLMAKSLITGCSTPGKLNCDNVGNLGQG